MKTAVIYARFSSARQREASIADQIRVCREWCDENGYTVIRTYSDHAQSGRTDERAAFQEMISNAGESDIVLVYMFDRFSRDRFDSAIYKKKLKDKGVRVVSATEAMPDSPEGMVIESLYEAMAALESANTSKRVRRGMEGNAMKCHYNGNTLFGYDVDENGRYILNESESEIVRECFARKAAGESINSIAKDLASRGIGSRGKPATYGFVHNMLRNERYTGVYKWGDIRIPGGMPQIVTPAQFELAAVASKRKQSDLENWSSYILSGKLLCGCCGSDMSGTSARGRGNKKYCYYRCKHCQDKPIRADYLETGIAAAIRELLSDRETALSVARAVELAVDDKSTGAMVKALKSELKAAQTELDNLIDAVAKGFDFQPIQKKAESLATKAESLERRIKAAEMTMKFDVSDFANFLQFGATLTDEKLLDTFVYQVLLNPDEVLVTLNYDTEKGEPFRLSLPTVRPIRNWWTISSNSRITMTVINGCILIRFPRVA